MRFMVLIIISKGCSIVEHDDPNTSNKSTVLFKQWVPVLRGLGPR